MSVYANLSHKRKTKKDSAARKRAEYLATLPKNPIKRFFYRLHPKRVAKYWFSKRGAIMAAKIVGIGALLLVLLVGGLFAYYRKDLDQIRPGELAKRVQTTVTTYLDRNGQVLWEDKGNGNYKLVVDSKDINPLMKEATVAIEDKDFYVHGGVSLTGMVRAAFSNLTGGSTQGGSTLTQQLVKQVFFADQASDRGLGGIPRKIKEAILAVEVERMYNKDQILTLYLNESPYGGRRNGVESAAQTYFGKSAKDLTLPEAALLAAIPQNPSTYDPYNIAGHDALIARQHQVIDNMVAQKMISQADGDAAKKVAILDTIKPEETQYEGIKAPHFVQMVRTELESELGKATVGKGGLVVKTTLDLRVQDKLQEAMNTMFQSYAPNYAGFTDGAADVEDTQTGQIIALLGSRDFNYPGFGQDNAATAFIQPGSSIKPFVYSQFFKGNYGTGTILPDQNIDALYGAKVQNADRKFKGNITVRDSLAQSRNIPAIEAMAIAGVQPTIANIRAMGDTYYCTQGQETQAGLSAAIGGCGTRMIDHVNAYATLATLGTYHPETTILEVKNSQGEILKQWKDQSKQVLDPQIAYMVSDELTDENARRPLIGNITKGFLIPGVKTGTKTGTTDLGGYAKDIWMMSYSPVLSMGVWLGNPDTRLLKNGDSTLPGPIVSTVMEYAHQLYVQEGKYTPNGWLTRPNGIQTIGGELYPSWYDKSKGLSTQTMTFDKVSKKLATDLTPAGARIDLTVTKSTDPISKKPIYIAPSGYDATSSDDVHKSTDPQPVVTISANKNTIVASVAGGTGSLTVDVTIDGVSLGAQTVNGAGPVSFNVPDGSSGKTAVATVTDSLYYASTSNSVVISK